MNTTTLGHRYTRTTMPCPDCHLDGYVGHPLNRCKKCNGGGWIGKCRVNVPQGTMVAEDLFGYA